ncbi:MAG: YHS domain-containing protein [Candidatus Zixiibacteriota bacterium]|nr:MAG: YHS domain-containing protein [candidate division Zixibacteria bacterium]
MKKVFPLFGLAILLSAALITLAVTGEPSKDPVCGMEVDPASAQYTIESPHGTIYFCSASCKEKFAANPSAYMKASSAPKAKGGCEGCAVPCEEATKAAGTAAAPDAGCGSHAAPAAAPAHAAGHDCTGDCGSTKMKEINDFHVILMPMEEAAAKGDVAPLKAGLAQLLEGKEAIMKAGCPEGVQTAVFEAARAEFCAKLDVLAASVQSGDDAAVTKAFADLHDAYRAMDEQAR